MNRKTTPDIIHTLVADLGQPHRVWPVWIRAAVWVVVTLLLMAAIVAYDGLRQDMPGKMHDFSYLTMMALLAPASLGMAAAGLWLAVPRLQVPAWIYGVMVLCAGFYLGLAGWLLWPYGIAMQELWSHEHMVCAREVLLLSLIPGIGLFTLLRRAAPTHRGLASCVAGFAAGMVALMCSLLLCANEGHAHLLVGHFLPVLIATLVGGVGGWFFLRW